MKLALIIAVCAPLAACANSLTSVTNNRACTTKVNGEVAFGSITPTGKVRFSAVCKPGELMPPPAAEVAAPAAPQDVNPPT